MLKTCFSTVAPLSNDSKQPVALKSTLACGGPWAELGRVGERPLAAFERMAHCIHGDYLEALKVCDDL